MTKADHPTRRLALALAGSLALTGLATPAAAQETLRAVTAFPAGLTFSKSFLGFVEAVNERGEGVIRITYAGGPEVIPAMQQADAVRRGVIDMQYGPASYYLGTMPEADAWVGSTVSAAEGRANGGFALMRQAMRETLGVQLVAHLDSGVQFHIYTTEEPPRGADGGVDLDGLRIRSQPIYNGFLEALGAIPVSIPVPEVYTALERNTVDGAGWPIVSSQDLGWDKFLRYRIDPGFYQTDLGVIMNPAKWDALSDEAKRIIEEVAIDYEKSSRESFQQQTADTDAAVRAAGMQVITLEGAAAEAYLDEAYDRAWGRMEAAGSPLYDALRDAYYDR